MAIQLLGEVLIKKGFIDRQKLNEVLRESPHSEEMLGKVLLKKGLISEEQLAQGIAEQLGIPFYPHLKDVDISLETLKAVPVKLVQHYRFMPLELNGDALTIAVHNPMDIWMVENIKLQLGFQVRRVLASKADIDEAIRKYYGAVAGTVDKILTKDKEEQGVFVSRKEGVEEIERDSEEASVIKLVNQILTEAIQMEATDIHLEVYEDNVHLRYRVDGVLKDVKIPENIYYLEPAIVSRIKIMAHLDVVEHRLPQDGRMKVKLQDASEVDLRVSIIPAYYGENIVIRILPTQMLFDFAKIGFSPEDRAKIERIIQKLHGIILITGPTGSGKTTTLYACLSRLNLPGNKIISVEDPVEYALEGMTQIHVNPKVGLTFANALRSILRHDPDILMIGEIRDFETADLAIRASLTGHLVFSTLHTNNAPAGITRLLDMGLEPFLLASSLEVIIAQRLVRLLCLECKGKGCDACSDPGFKGRTAIFEILFIDEDIQQMVLNRRSAGEIKKKAKEKGMRTLRESGMLLVEKGLTTEQEVLRVAETEG